MKARKWTDEQLIEAVKECDSWRAVAIKLGLSEKSGGNTQSIIKHCQELNLDITHILNRPKTLTEEEKKKISVARKKFLADHKEEHNWSKFRREESKPELLFRDTLILLGIPAFRFYIPPENDRFFELDFALPEKKIAFEINGNQHYNNDGYLSEYYQDRHQYFIDRGWILHEIHYSECFDADKIKTIIQDALVNIDIEYVSSPEIVNYRRVRKEEKLKKKQKERELRALELSIRRAEAQLKKDRDKLTPEELLEIRTASAKTMLEKRISKKGIPQPHLRRVEWPSKEELQKLLWEKPTTHIANDFGVSDKAVEKWTKLYGIEKPPRGYWRKLQAEQQSYQIVGSKNCEWCNVEFVLTNASSSQKYCSDKCQTEAAKKRRKERGYRKPPKEKLCQATDCNNTFIVDNGSNKKYCSRECRLSK